MFWIKYRNLVIAAFSLFILFSARGGQATIIGERTNFNVDQSFESGAKSQVAAVLVKSTNNIYFYVEEEWWGQQVSPKQNEILVNLDRLSFEFDNKIYPNLTSIFGNEWRPGVDGDSKLTILFHSMKEDVGGYFRSADEYLNLQIPNSNEREMIYLSLAHVDSSKLKVFLAHEFVHLITFNQKDRLRDVQEEIWLNEGRAEYTANILGYNRPYDGSNLQKRVKDFLANASDSLTEWREVKYDYAVINLFIYYLADHYGINVLSDSLKSDLTGIASINKVLQENGYKEDFSQIFTNWTISLIVNDCSINLSYCYLNENLNSLKINSALIFLPISGDSSLSVSNVTKNWSGNWQKIIGGKGDLHLKFESLAGLNFRVPYIVFDKDGNYSIEFIKLDKSQKGEIDIKDFGGKYISLIMIPSLQTKYSGFNGIELTQPYTFTVSITMPVLQEDQVLIQKLLIQIESLKKQIAALKAAQDVIACVSIKNNLYFGISNNNEVRCLQQFLKNQGTEIYPEGLVTGNFLTLTKLAIVRFQKKHQIYPSGFVGILTRTKINELSAGQNF